ncbi:DUF883 family protein [Halomonas organivorans]
MADHAPHTRDTTRQLKEDLQHLSQTVEELVNATADDSRHNIKELRERAERRLNETRARLEARGERAYQDARDTVTHQADACDRYVHDHPWTSIGIGAAVGVVVGLLIGRR